MALRCYLQVDAGATRTQAQWDTFILNLRPEPMVAAVLSAASRVNNPCNFVNFNLMSTNPIRRYCIGDFQIENPDIAGLRAVNDAEVTRLGITGAVGDQAKFVAVLQAELREVVTNLGFPAIAALVVVTMIGFHATDYTQAIAQAQAYLAANAAIWT